MIVEDDARTSPIKFFFPTVAAQPVNAVGVIGGQAVFTVSFSSTNPALVTFLWQCSIDSGTTWTDLVETVGYYTGVTTQSLTVKAIDNYLATRTGLQFRCRALFANAVPSFSNGATLTVPIHTDFQLNTRMAIAVVAGDGNSNTAQFFPAPTVTGFSGPFTYLWSIMDGDANIQPTSNTTGAAFFINFNPIVVAGWTVARWRCTVSNGMQSVASDPYVIAVYAYPGNPATNGIQKDDAFPPTSSDGAQLSANTAGIATFIPPWQIAYQENLRSLTPPVASIVAPTQEATTFALSTAQKGGTAVLFYVAAIAQEVLFPLQFRLLYGLTSWLK